LVIVTDNKRCTVHVLKGLFIWLFRGRNIWTIIRDIWLFTADCAVWWIECYVQN